MLPDKNVMCPYSAFKTSCFDNVTKRGCPKWIHVAGTNANNGEHVDAFDCADRWLPALLMEQSKQLRQAGAAVESLRNIVADVNNYQPSVPYQSPKLIEATGERV